MVRTRRLSCSFRHKVFACTLCAKYGTIELMKLVVWDSAAKKAVRAFADEAKREIGTLLMMLQQGEVLGMPQARAMKSVHRSAFELRVKDKNGIYRVFYVLVEGDKILVPHAFTKKTQKTPQKEIDSAIKRLRRLLNETI